LSIEVFSVTKGGDSTAFLGSIFQGVERFSLYLSLQVQLEPVVSQNAPGRCEGQGMGSAASRPAGLPSGGRPVIFSHFPTILQTARNSSVALSSPRK